jgi:L-alanine-DL-glutamate epimerase-like enolase superfamily enzyme
MKITHVSTTLVALPHDEPLADGPTTPGSKNFVALKLGTDQGIEGLGFTFFGGSLDQALLTAVQALAELTIGENPHHIEAIVDKLRKSSPAGPGGIFTLALSAIDIALWDIKGKLFAELDIFELLTGLANQDKYVIKHLADLKEKQEAYLKNLGF